METYVQKLHTVTFSLHYHPHFGQRFQVRLVGKSAYGLDDLQDDSTKDIIGWGNSFEEAAKKAWQKKFE